MFKYLDVVAGVLLIVGGLNWGLVGWFDFNLVTFLFGETMVTTVVYSLVALAAVYQVYYWKKVCSCF